MVELFAILIISIIAFFIYTYISITTSNKKIEKDAFMFSWVFAALCLFQVIYIGTKL